MVDRVWFVGSSDQTADQIEQSLADALDQLETHLSSRPYLFGARPSFGDFGMWGQIYNANRDPTPARLVRAHPNVHAWTRRMLAPLNEGEFESWDAVKDTLVPLIRDQIGALFLPWSVANNQAITEGSETFEVELAGKTWAQKPQKYHARSLAAASREVCRRIQRPRCARTDRNNGLPTLSRNLVYFLVTRSFERENIGVST